MNGIQVSGLVSPLPSSWGFLMSLKWNEPLYLKGRRLGFSLVYSNKIFESDAKFTHLNKTLDIGHLAPVYFRR